MVGARDEVARAQLGQLTEGAQRLVRNVQAEDCEGLELRRALVDRDIVTCARVTPYIPADILAASQDVEGAGGAGDGAKAAAAGAILVAALPKADSPAENTSAEIRAY